MHQEGEAGPTSTPAPPSRPPRPQSSSPGNLASALPIASPPGGAPNPPLLPESSLCRWVATGGPEKPRGLGWGELGWRRGEEEETGLSGCCRPVSVPGRARRPSPRGRAALGPPSLAPPPQPPSGTSGSGCPGNLGRGACLRALGGKGGGGKTHTGTRTHASTMDAGTRPICGCIPSSPALAAEPPVAIQVWGTPLPCPPSRVSVLRPFHGP